MVSLNVNNLLQQAKSLTLSEREQFIQLLRSQPAGQEQHTPSAAWTQAFHDTFNNAVTVGRDVDDSRESIYRGCGT